MKICLRVLAICFILTPPILAQENATTHTLKFDSLAGSPKATLSAISWINGHWQGEALGGIAEEIWSGPLGGSMMGSFKLVVDNQVNFYEILTISEEEETIILRLKHFHANLKGWEEKDETIDFKLVKVSENMVYFDQMSFEKISENEINVYVVFHHKDGGLSEARFNYQRVPVNQDKK